jgi:hypothetical protein
MFISISTPLGLTIPTIYAMALVLDFSIMAFDMTDVFSNFALYEMVRPYAIAAVPSLPEADHS